MDNRCCVLGEFCEILNRPCDSDPCGENGTCVELETENGFMYNCTSCSSGFIVSMDQQKCNG